MSETTSKAFDCAKSMREIRNRINSEIADMSYAELSQWLDKQVQEDPFFARIATTPKPARPLWSGPRRVRPVLLVQGLETEPESGGHPVLFGNATPGRIPADLGDDGHNRETRDTASFDMMR